MRRGWTGRPVTVGREGVGCCSGDKTSESGATLIRVALLLYGRRGVEWVEVRLSGKPTTFFLVEF